MVIPNISSFYLKEGYHKMEVKEELNGIEEEVFDEMEEEAEEQKNFADEHEQ